MSPAAPGSRARGGNPRPLVLVAACCFAAPLAGCGANHTEVPPALLDAIAREGTSSSSDGGATSYPAAPYGAQIGDTVQNLCFQGWKDPEADGYDPSKFGSICLSDFHDDGDARLLLLESCAVWCSSCRYEYAGSQDRASLAAELAARQSKGFRVLGTLFQGATNSPATPADATTWAKQFKVAFPFALDDQHEVGLFTSPNSAPFNLLVDTKTMKIVLELAGDDPLVLIAKVDAFLSQPAP